VHHGSAGHIRFVDRQRSAWQVRNWIGIGGQEEEMTSFDERQNAFERKFAHDEELKFKATARRDRRIGLWAAELLGLSGEEAEAYAKDMVRINMAKPGDQDVLDKLRADFAAAGIEQSDHQIARRMDEMLAEAVAHVESTRQD
jgi:hypothetical protein